MPLPKCNVDLPASSSVSRIFKLYLSLILSPSRLRVQNLLSDEKTMIKISSSCDKINKMMMVNFLKPVVRAGGGGRGTPYDGHKGRLHPKGGIFFKLQVYERVGISLVEEYKKG